MTTRDYVRRRPRQNERERIEDATRVFEQSVKNLRFHPENDLSTVEFRLTNRLNPNGFTIIIGPDGKPKVQRFINLTWAQKHGYTDAWFTSTGQRPRRRLRPGPLTPPVPPRDRRVS